MGLDVADGIRNQVHMGLHSLTKPQFSQKQEEDRKAIGGMRLPRHSISKLPYHKVLGAQVRGAIDKFLEYRPDLQHQVLSCLGLDKERAQPPSPDDIQACCDRLKQALPHDDPIGDRLTQLNANLLMAWIVAAKDPDLPVASWLMTGAPAGILHHAEQVGIFPASGETTEEGKQRSLQEWPLCYQNYISM